MRSIEQFSTDRRSWLNWADGGLVPHYLQNNTAWRSEIHTSLRDKLIFLLSVDCPSTHGSRVLADPTAFATRTGRETIPYGLDTSDFRRTLHASAGARWPTPRRRPPRCGRPSPNPAAIVDPGSSQSGYRCSPSPQGSRIVGFTRTQFAGQRGHPDRCRSAQPALSGAPGMPAMGRINPSSCTSCRVRPQLPARRRSRHGKPTRL